MDGTNVRTLARMAAGWHGCHGNGPARRYQAVAGALAWLATRRQGWRAYAATGVAALVHRELATLVATI